MINLDDTIMNDDSIAEDIAHNTESENINKVDLNFDFLKTKTGPGSVSDYIDNPLNFNNSESVAQILRGITGYTDDLNLAILDIAFGMFKGMKGMKKNEKA